MQYFIDYRTKIKYITVVIQKLYTDLLYLRIINEF